MKLKAAICIMITGSLILLSGCIFKGNVKATDDSGNIIELSNPEGTEID